MNPNDLDFVSKLINEIARLKIERDRYSEALNENRNVMADICHALKGGTNPTLSDLQPVMGNLARAWTFKQHGCPKCGKPCEFMFAMSMVGPHVWAWDCTKCGVTRSEGGSELALILATREAFLALIGQGRTEEQRAATVSSLDARDAAAARDALADIKENGTVSFEQLKADLGL